MQVRVNIPIISNLQWSVQVSFLGSTSSTPHVSITTAVILAAAGGAEMILEPEHSSQDSVKPILKKKSFSEEYSYRWALNITFRVSTVN